MNDHAFTVSVDEVKTMVLRAASSDITEAEWSTWLQTAAAPKP